MRAGAGKERLTKDRKKGLSKMSKSAINIIFSIPKHQKYDSGYHTLSVVLEKEIWEFLHFACKSIINKANKFKIKAHNWVAQIIPRWCFQNKNRTNELFVTVLFSFIGSSIYSSDEKRNGSRKIIVISNNLHMIFCCMMSSTLQVPSPSVPPASSRCHLRFHPSSGTSSNPPPPFPWTFNF